MVEFGYLLLDRAVMLSSANHGFAFIREGAGNMLQALAEPGGVVIATAAGCGGGAPKPRAVAKPPHLSHALAHAWAAEIARSSLLSK